MKSRALTFIFITLLIDVIGWGIIIPVTPKLIGYLTGNPNVNEAAGPGSWLMVTFAIAQFIFSPIMGGLSDKYGRRPVLLFSLLGFGLDYIFQAFSPTLLLLFVGRAIAGITGASFTTAAAYIADVSPPEKRAANFGLIGAAFGMGFIIGPLIGGFAADIGRNYISPEMGIRLPFLAAAGFSLINFCFGLFIMPESLKKENRRPFDWKRANPIGSLLNLRKYPVVSGLVVSLTLVYVGVHAVQSNWSYFTMFRFGWSEKMVGISLAVVGALVGLVQGLLTRQVNKKLGAKNSVYLGLSLYATGLLLFAFANQQWMMFAFLVPYCLGGVCGPALQGIISGQVPANAQGELQGALTSLMSATTIVGPLIMNNLFTFFSRRDNPIVYFPGAPFAMGALLIFMSILFAINTLKHRYVAADNPSEHSAHH